MFFLDGVGTGKFELNGDMDFNMSFCSLVTLSYWNFLLEFVFLE